jgi:CHASE3 domain sensor protein
MTLSFERGDAAPRSGMNLGAGLGLAFVVAFFLISGAVAYQNINTLRTDALRVQHSHDVIVAMDDLLSTVQDAETGQRGYLLTGREQYLGPYSESVARVAQGLDKIEKLTSDNDAQQARLDGLRRHANAKLAELKQTIDLRRANRMAEALAIVNADRGKVEMDAVRAQLSEMRQEEARLRRERRDEMEAAYKTAWVTGLLSGALGVVLTLIVGLLMYRSSAARERQQWL